MHILKVFSQKQLIKIIIKAKCIPMAVPPEGLVYLCITAFKWSPLFVPVPPGVYILIGAGSLVMLVGFFGCCGAVRESQCLLGSVSEHAHKLMSKKSNPMFVLEFSTKLTIFKAYNTLNATLTQSSLTFFFFFFSSLPVCWSSLVLR